jgi:branched-chain amino acid transport system permease protein
MKIPLLPRQGIVSLSEMCFLALCLILAATIRHSHYADIMILTFLWSGLALSWNIAGGYAGLISFGHAAFLGIAAYTSTLLLVDLGISPWLGIWVGASLAAIFGGVLTLICARLRGPFFILSTLAAGEVTRIAAMNWRSLTGGSEGLEIPPTANLANMVFVSKLPYVVLVLCYFIAIFLVSKYLERSRFGYYLFAIRGDEEAASSVGVNPLWMRIGAMTLSAFLTGVGGSLFAQYFLYLDPTHVISPELSFQFALICAIGGLGTATGPVIGAFIVTPLSEFLRSWLAGAASGMHLAIYGLVLIVVILYFPSGVAGAIGRLKRGRNTLPSATQMPVETRIAHAEDN